MRNDYLNIYNNLIKLTRNKNLYFNLKNDDTFSDRKDYINLFYSILGKIENWENLEEPNKIDLISDFINIKDNNISFISYLDNYRAFLLKNSLKLFTKDIIELKF